MRRRLCNRTVFRVTARLFEHRVVIVRVSQYRTPHLI
jgi:hypothetical protein